jgi:hypothetical protein
MPGPGYTGPLLQISSWRAYPVRDLKKKHILSIFHGPILASTALLYIGGKWPKPKQQNKKRTAMFQRFAHRCLAYGSLLRAWHQDNVKTVKYPHC